MNRAKPAQRLRSRRSTRDDSGLSMVITMASMVVAALLSVLLMSTMFHSSGSTSTAITNAPGVALADDLQAQQSLSTGLSAAQSAAATSGGYSSVEVSMLSASESSVEFVSGPTTGATAVSVEVDAQGPGSVTLADRSSDGICWFVWQSTGGAAWYGAQTGAASCAAPDLASPPAAGAPSSTAIGWQQGSFPAA